MKTYILGLLLLLSSSLYAQTEVLQGVTRGKDYGVVYTLPKTEIHITVKANKITYTPGEFSRYADRYLRLNNVSGEAEVYWELSSVEAVAVGVPDENETYFIKMKDRTSAPLVELTEDGLIKSINVPLAPKSQEKARVEEKSQVRKLNPRDFLTEEILMANSSAKMAELTSKEIYNIRESRNALVRGQADNMPTDGEQLRLMLETLDLQENALLELFSGTKTKEEQTFTFKIIPDKEFKDEVVFRFSKKLGVTDKRNLAGEPYYFNLTDLKSIKIPLEDPKKTKIEGIAYNVPGRAQMTITNKKDFLLEGDLLITQFGIIEYLAPTLFNKNLTTKVYFNPESGSLKKVERE
ncbi:MAG: DUF4831 family protein [Bacteroides sp.]|nr:DUF4831 family protein [Bacteroides sp.]